jgi:hypothetical protein
MLLISFILFQSSCSWYPGGMTGEQWRALPDEERQAIRAREIGALEGKRYEQPSTASLNNAHRNAQYGEVVQVTLERGVLTVNGNSKVFMPITVDLVRGQQIEVPLRTPLETGHAISVRLGDNGNTIQLEGFEPCGNDGWDRNTPVWDKGKEYHPNERPRNPSGVKDLIVFVRYKPIP